MNSGPAVSYFPLYFAGWAFLAIFSWLWIRSRPTPQEKKLWSDRMSIIAAVFVTGFICFVLVLWRQYAAIPIAAASGALIAYLNVRNTFYCDACGKRSTSHIWFTRSVHCPHCGHKLR
jgi:predicted RNA-binding Zn-ribbon protein involved in translation (DUF1610 family)